MNDQWSPILLNVHTGAFAAAEDVATCNPRRLLNPTQSAMLVDQFRFTFGLGENKANRGDSLLTLLASMAVEIRLGSTPLMPRPVPIGLVSSRFMGLQSPTLQLDAISTPDTCFVWHLDKPMLVPPGVQLSANFVRQTIVSTGFSAASVFYGGVSFSVVGRSLPQQLGMPKKIWVPWVAATEVKTDVTRFVSGDGDMVNAHAEPLHLKALTGLYVKAEKEEGALSQPPTVQMTASNNLPIIRDATPFMLLFPEDRGVLKVDAVLQPGQFLRTELEAEVALAAPKTIQYTGVAMHGRRLIDTPKAL